MLFSKKTSTFAIIIVTFLVQYFTDAAFSSVVSTPCRRQSQQKQCPFRTTSIRTNRLLLSPSAGNVVETREREAKKDQLLTYLSSTPSNLPTSSRKTEEILSLVKELETLCPTEEENVLRELNGNWELIWTAQDNNSAEAKKGLLRTWINPLENQSYSNNPTGRSNPMLPQEIQNKLEDLKILQPNSSPVRSSQSISLKRGIVRNVVSFQTPVGIKGSLTVLVKFVPDDDDARKINVKFESCRVQVSRSPVDFLLPLGPIGPTGWLKTTYVDNIRITRGFKGSVFILKRTGSK